MAKEFNGEKKLAGEVKVEVEMGNHNSVFQYLAQAAGELSIWIE